MNLSASSRQHRTLRSWHSWMATAGGIGLVPKAPGTFGSLPGLAVGYGLVQWTLTLQAQSWSMSAIVALLTALFAASTAVAVRAIAGTERAWGEHDPGAIVIDEVIGQALAVAIIASTTWMSLLAAFVMFRILDIAKPWPISWVDQKVGGAWGTMLDDVLAGAMAGALVLAGHAIFL